MTTPRALTRPARSRLNIWAKAAILLGLLALTAWNVSRSDALSEAESELLIRSLSRHHRRRLETEELKRMLYTAQDTWRIDAENGRLSRTGMRLPGATQIVASQDGMSVYFLNGVRGSIDQATTDSLTGEVHFKTNVTVVHKPTSLAIKTA